MVAIGGRAVGRPNLQCTDLLKFGLARYFAVQAASMVRTGKWSNSLVHKDCLTASNSQDSSGTRGQALDSYGTQAFDGQAVAGYGQANGDCS